MVYKSSNLCIDEARLLDRIQSLGQMGRDPEQKLTRLAASAADKSGRDALVA